MLIEYYVQQNITNKTSYFPGLRLISVICVRSSLLCQLIVMNALSYFCAKETDIIKIGKFYCREVSLNFTLNIHLITNKRNKGGFWKTGENLLSQ